LLIGNRWTGDETLLFPVYSSWASRQPDTRGSLSFTSPKFLLSRQIRHPTQSGPFPVINSMRLLRFNRAPPETREKMTTLNLMSLGTMKFRLAVLISYRTSSGWQIFLLCHYTRCKILCFVEKFVLTWWRKLWYAKGFRGVKCANRDFVEECLFFAKLLVEHEMYCLKCIIVNVS